MNFWKKLFGKNDNNTEVIVAVVMENEMKVFDSIEHASRYFTDRNMASALESIQKLKNRTERNVKAIKITEDFEIIEYPSLQKLKEDQSKNKKN